MVSPSVGIVSAVAYYPVELRTPQPSASMHMLHVIEPKGLLDFTSTVNAQQRESSVSILRLIRRLFGPRL